ncbi:MAG: hypothetical protein MUC85_05635, partial [Anaerolineales bacterium]|nr:hypothetical protein [Anaerolineales bacterium]
MTKRKIFSFIMVLVFLFSFVGENITTLAKSAPPPLDTKPDKPVKVTQADREAAAARAEADGFTIEAVGAADMAMAGDAPRYFSHPNYANSPLPGNIVAEWNAFAQDLLQPMPDPNMPMAMSTISMSKSFVILAYMQAAVYDALVAIEGGYEPYNAGILAFTDASASREAAVSTAAFKTLEFALQNELNYATVFQPVLEARYADALASIPTSAAKDAGIGIGQAAANGIISLRSGDVLSGSGGYVVPAPGPGVWEQVVMNNMPVPPMDPWMRNLQPFLRSTPDQYNAALAAVMPDLTDAEYMNNDPAYIADFEEVKAYGGAMSAVRTPDQTETAKFWTTNMVIQANASYRNAAETRGLNLLDTARLMAMGNMIATDSLIATFSIKYQENFWRPYTAIQHTISNAGVYAYSATTVNTWMPAFPTPNFPEFVAGHGSFVSSQAELFTQFFGTNQIELDLLSTANGTTRHYVLADDLRAEVVNARTWGGMHFRTSTDLAVTLGQQFVQDALASTSYFDPAPVTDTGNHALVSGGIRKFVDELAQLCDPSVSVCTGTSTLGQYLPVAVPDKNTYAGSDYYEIAVVQYREQMHSDLPPTLLRGYVQISTTQVPGAQVKLYNELLDGSKVDTGFYGVTEPHYLGPTIVAAKDRPVRVKFYNLLPTGIAGDLFLPVDVTVMGSGMGPDMYGVEDTDGQNPMCGMAYDMTDPANPIRVEKDPRCYE